MNIEKDTDNTAPDPTASIGDDLRAAFADAAPEAEPTGETPEAPGAVEPAEIPGDRPRGPDGKFAKATDVPAAVEKPETLTLKPGAKPLDTPAAPDQQATVAAPPPGWSVASKTAFATLPDAVKADIAKREQEVAAGFQKYAQREASYKEIAQVLEPRIPELQSAGLSVPAALQRLFAAGDALQRDTPGAILQIAKNAGIDLAQLAAVQNGGRAPQPGAHPQAGPVDPTIAALTRQVQELTGFVTQERQQQAQAERSAADTEIAAFGADTNNVYFENVRGEMARLLQGGFAENLPQAYQMACSMNPEIRDALLQERVRSEIEKRAAEQKQRVATARAANGSLTGAPSPGSIGGIAPQDNLRAELEEQFRSGRA